MFYVYIHCKPDGTPFYIGKGCGGRSRNFSNRNAHYRNIIKKYGRKNIQVLVIPCDSEATAYAREIELIRAFRTFGFELANKTSGGEGCSADEATRKRLSELKKGKPLSAEHRAKLAIVRKGNQNAKGLKGRPQTPEHKAKRAQALRERNPKRAEVVCR